MVRVVNDIKARAAAIDSTDKWLAIMAAQIILMPESFDEIERMMAYKSLLIYKS